mmetsp:Transcript_13709/g.30058  ORF Transcript_13709/g.30058 Transcript_13709/m.30058 type:complete len:480 (-) Transcript_13709:45-1484(-)
MPKPRNVGITAASASADGRKLEGLDSVFFNSKFALSGVLSAKKSRGMERSDKKLIQAFDRVIATTPLLQTQILDDGKTFQQVSPKEWPQLQILDLESPTDEGLMAMARSQLDNAIAKEREEKGDDGCSRRPVISAMIMRSPNRVAWMIATPHQFGDGIANGVMFVKFCQYARLSRALWPALDRFSDQGRVPTFYEMGLKSDYSRYKDKLENLDLTKAARLDKRNFCFSQYNMDSNKLYCRAKSCLSLIETKDLGVLRKDLRSEHGLTITSVFGALAAKVMTLLLHGSNVKDSVFSTSASSEEHEKRLAVNIPMDGRSVGKWNDQRDKVKKLPVGGSFSFACISQVKLSACLNGTLEEVGRCIKKSLDECRKDPEVRAIAMRASSEPHESNLLIGCSSIIIPKGAGLVTGMRKMEFDCNINFGPMPHVWFYVITSGKGAQVDVDIALPIDGYKNESEVITAIHDAASGTILESYLSATLL